MEAETEAEQRLSNWLSVPELRVDDTATTEGLEGHVFLLFPIPFSVPNTHTPPRAAENTG